MILFGILVWYFMKLLWYLMGRSQESEFDKVKETEVLANYPEILKGQISRCWLIESASRSGLPLTARSPLRP
jgi:hypothetical protein